MLSCQQAWLTLTITAEIDKQYGVIVEASCTLATEHGRDYINRLLKGHSLRNGIEMPLHQLQKEYLGKANNALVAALKDLYKQYESLSQ